MGVDCGHSIFFICRKVLEKGPQANIGIFKEIAHSVESVSTSTNNPSPKFLYLDQA